MARGVQSESYPCPDWYGAAHEAKWLGVPVPDIVNVPLWWREKARNAMREEAEAQKILSDLHK